MLRDDSGAQRLVALDDAGGSLWVGRGASATICLSWDEKVSGLHAQLEPGGGEWTLADDGLSRNGSYVNSERLHGRRRLRDGDMLRFGSTVALYRAPSGDGSRVDGTVVGSEVLTAASLSESQRRVLVALCRPFKEGGFATPATNQQIADELFLSVDAVKTHLRALFAKLGVEDLPQNAKRAGLVERALQSGLISGREL